MAWATIAPTLAGQAHGADGSPSAVPTELIEASARSAKGELDQVVKVDGFVVRTYRDMSMGHATIEILKGGKRVFWRSNHEVTKYRVGCINEDDEGNTLIKPGKDITGRGKPNLVVSSWTGGMHCCFGYSILELGDEIKEVGSIRAGHGDVCIFRSEANGGLDFVVNDWMFAYWHASFFESPAPEVILRYAPGGYVVATDLMRKPAPSAEQFNESVKKGRKLKLDDDGWPESTFWKTMLDFIYSGHSDLAWKYCDLAWPGKPEVKGQFLKEFRQQLAHSPYWSAIKTFGPQ